MQEENISNEKTLDLLNYPIVLGEEILYTSINDFSFYEQNEKIEMNEFDIKILTEYVNEEKNIVSKNKKLSHKKFKQLNLNLSVLKIT